MGRKKKYLDLPCPFPDCFSCPHPDCIKDVIFEPGRTRAPSVARKRIPTEEEKARRRARANAYYQKNRDAINANKRMERARDKEARGAQKHLPDGAAGQRADAGKGG